MIEFRFPYKNSDPEIGRDFLLCPATFPVRINTCSDFWMELQEAPPEPGGFSHSVISINRPLLPEQNKPSMPI